MSGAAECGAVVLWASGLCAVGAATAVSAALPRNREGFSVGLAGGVVLGMFVTLAWYVSAACAGC